MATFSTNQARQLFVAGASVAQNAIASVGDLALGESGDYIYFNQKNATGEMVRTDLIKKDQIKWINVTPGGKMGKKLKKYKLTLDATINGGQPISGQDYICRIAFRQFIGMSDEDQYFKFGAVHAYASMDDEEFYCTMAASLWMNFSREATPILKFYLDDVEVAGVKTVAGKKVPVDAAGDVITDASCIIIEEVPQEWRRGVKSQVPVFFEVQPTTITVSGDEVNWGVVEEDTGASEIVTTTVIPNGKDIADLEYFCMGERADQYRGIAWPHNIETKYLVDDVDAFYDVLDIQYYYVGDGVDAQKSDKTLTIVAKSDVAGGATLGSVMTAIKTAITGKVGGTDINVVA